MSEEDLNCGAGNDFDGRLHLRIGGIFIIFVTSLIGTILPVAARRTQAFRFPEFAYNIAKFFGSGVIIATAFIHLLTPAFEALGSPCLTGGWTVYPWAAAFSMAAVFALFIVELFAFRIGTSIMNSQVDGKPYDPHNHSFAAHGPEVEGGHFSKSLEGTASFSKKEADLSKEEENVFYAQEFLEEKTTAQAQILGVAILEFGVIFHSAVIGLTLGVANKFTTLFVVIIFHQMFEGLGLGSRLSSLPLPRNSWIPWLGAVAYSITTPLGLAIALGVRNTYNPESKTASIVSGTLDAISSGVLLYTGLVELLAHEFLFNESMRKASNGKVLFAVFNVLLGAGIMALLGRWA